MGIDAIKKEAARLNLELMKSTPDEGSPIVRWGCTCSECGTKVMTHFKTMTDPSRVVAAIESKGWEFWQNQPVCPTCVNKAKQEKKMTNTPKNDVIANLKLQRKVFDLLNEHFSETSRTYSNGWSDKKIAEAAQTSEVFVAKLRNEAYAELAEDPMVTAIRNEITDLEKHSKTVEDMLLNEMTKISEKVSGLSKRLDMLSMKKTV
jgi:hypothetical protein